MTNDELKAAILALPAPDVLETSSINDAPGDGAFYSAHTVARLLAEQRERFARMCEQADKSTHPAMLADTIRTA